MDILTQGLLGATTALAVSPSGAATRAPNNASAPAQRPLRVALIGFAAGLLADADILIQSADDPLLNLDYHRHFSHALLFVPFGSLLASLLVWPLASWWWRMPFARIYRCAFAGYALSGLLDACTGYGTHLLWPFSDTRTAWNLISVIDPIFTGGLLVATALTLLDRSRDGWQRSACRARAGLGFAAAYLLLALVQQQRVLDEARLLADSRGHTITLNASGRPRLVARPSFANIVLWRAIYESQERVYVAAIRPTLIPGGETRVYPGESVALYATSPDSPGNAKIPRDSRLAQDIQRFRRFSDSYIGMHSRRPGILGDLRFSMLPDSALPMWGIELNPARSYEHAEFRTFRQLNPADRQRFVEMLGGR